MFYRRQTKNAVNYSFTTFCDFFQVVPPGIEHLKFFVFKVLINSPKSYIVKIKTIELAIFLISIISIFIAVIFLTVQRYGKGSIPPNSIGIKLQKTL